MENLKPKRINRKFLFRLVGTLLAFLLLISLFAQQDWQDIRAAWKAIPVSYLGTAFVLMMISRLAVSARWYILLRATGIPVNFKQALRITFAGLFASNFLPTTVGGDMIRLAGALQLKFDAAISTASLIADRLVGMAGMAMVVPFGMPTFLKAIRASGGSLLPAAGLDFAAALLPLPGFLRKAYAKGLGMLSSVIDALSLWLKQPRALVLSLLCTWVHMVCLFWIIVLLFAGMDQPVSFWIAGGLYSIVYFITLLPVSINGYGLQEVSMTFVFTHFAGASLANGLTNAILFRTIMMAASLPGVFFVPGMVSGAPKGSEAVALPENYGKP
jgi:uncharacterized membrane protein YbhN (UPF0104 family)